MFGETIQISGTVFDFILSSKFALHINLFETLGGIFTT